VLDAAGLEAATLELPLGLGATVRWITALGELLGREAAASRLLQREQAALLDEVAWLAAEQLLGRRALVVGDVPLARALVGMLGELGMGVEALLLLSRSEAQDSIGLDAEIPIFRDPGDLDFEHSLRDGRPDLVIGNGAFSHLAIAAGLPVIELGYPSHYNHALAPRPYLGFAGLRRLVQDILEACLLRDERSHAGR
jgi:nitrogenase molybdenum-iron protein alpha/beta subunit